MRTKDARTCERCGNAEPETRRLATAAGVKRLCPRCVAAVTYESEEWREQHTLEEEARERAYNSDRLHRQERRSPLHGKREGRGKAGGDE